MALLNTLGILLVMIYTVQPYYYRTYCTSSADCGQGQCCRGSDGHLVGGDTTLKPQTGICVEYRNDMTALDDGCSCRCNKDSLCYQEITGVCCAPYTCRNANYVRERQLYWKNCLADINCALPPVARIPQEGVIR
ncbi:uncharacterized protein LOC132549647 [Ylistrum balloti]|uniref:uncharacterized protein LOC132549647 n=1 Tax=Ylistrum balloti TaxID=509963 RepID=UPI002905C66E|nr:uncharacterized protein LOC132549647 [Ylistrum balloti]